MSPYDILPRDDPHNKTLIYNARPPDWVNPQPDGPYNLVVIGGGSAGLIAAAGGAAVGARVALVEKNYLGGDCLNTGCVPSKALLRAGRAAYDARQAGRFGVSTGGEVKVDFQAVMDHVRAARATISPHDSARRYSEMGVDVFFGKARFTGERSITVDGRELFFSKALLAIGSTPATPPIPGLAGAGFLTNESVFNLVDRPDRLAVIGAGAIGVELAQGFSRLGSQVVLFEMADRVLPAEDETAAAVLVDQFQQEGIELCLTAEIRRVSAEGALKNIHFLQAGRSGEEIRSVDTILIATGRRPNLDGLDLDRAGVKILDGRIQVDDLLRTTNPAVYAAGDAALEQQFTHVAGHTGAIVVQNALFPFPKRKVSDLIIPRVIYTDPEIAQVGLLPSEAAAADLPIDTYTQQFDRNDRAITAGEAAGFAKIHTEQGKDTIVGATIVARHAGELISEITLAIKADVGLGSLSTLVFPYPTYSEIIGRAASDYNRTRLTPFVRKLFNWWLDRGR